MNKIFLFDKTMDKLQKTWLNHEPLVCGTRGNISGIRSSQIAALVMMLIEMGIIKEDE